MEDTPPVGVGEMLVFAVSAKTGTRRKVVQRDDDLLTPQQLQENWKEVQAARLNELKTWQELKLPDRLQECLKSYLMLKTYKY